MIENINDLEFCDNVAKIGGAGIYMDINNTLKSMRNNIFTNNIA